MSITDTRSLRRVTVSFALLAAVLTAPLMFAAGARAEEQLQEQRFSVDDEGFIHNWLLLDPIAVSDQASNHDEAAIKPIFDKEHFAGQNTANPHDTDKVVVDGKTLVWRPRHNNDWVLGLDDLAADTGKSSENALFLGVAYILCDEDIENVTLAIGSDDDSMWHLNGEEVIRVYEGRNVDKDQSKSKPVTLKKGLNVLRFAVVDGGPPTAAAARFLDKDGKPVTNIHIVYPVIGH